MYVFVCSFICDVYVLDVVGSRCAGGCAGARGRSGAAAHQRRDTGSDGFARELRTDEVHMTVECARRQNETFTGDRLRADAYH